VFDLDRRCPMLAVATVFDGQRWPSMAAVRMLHYTTKEVTGVYLPLWLSGLAISGRGAVKAWLAIRQSVGSYPTPAGCMRLLSSKVQEAKF